MLETLIFDVDGTLAETEELHRRAVNETFAEAGLDRHWTRADFNAHLKTTGGEERIARFLADTYRTTPSPSPICTRQKPPTMRRGPPAPNLPTPPATPR